MSQKLFSLNDDLRRLREAGYFTQIRGSLLLVSVPYVDAKREVRTGTLISSLALAGDRTRTPDTHVVHFDGEFPCDATGAPLKGISHGTGVFNLGHGVAARHSFSNKPAGGYKDYYDKMATYATILAGPAAVLQPGVGARPLREPEPEEESVFNYLDTASDRVGIGALSARLKQDTIAIIGLGGTGAYVFDAAAKTSAREIRLFDADDFLNHNAFRAPGAPSIEQLREAPKKVDYLAAIYSRMRRGIVPHAVALDANNLHLLDGVTFAFICIDAGEAKRLIVEKLEVIGASFIDVGMGLELTEDSLGGILRVTASTPEQRDHFRAKVSFKGGGADDLYATNIQVADLNALNAMLAVIKWKKLRGFYRDLENEHHATYTTDGNLLINSDQT